MREQIRRFRGTWGKLSFSFNPGQSGLDEQAG